MVERIFPDRAFGATFIEADQAQDHRLEGMAFAYVIDSWKTTLPAPESNGNVLQPELLDAASHHRYRDRRGSRRSNSLPGAR